MQASEWISTCLIKTQIFSHFLDFEVNKMKDNLSCLKISASKFYLMKNMRFLKKILTRKKDEYWKIKCKNKKSENLKN